MKTIIGITGASGGVYATSLLREFSKRNFRTHAVLSEAGRQVLRFECGLGEEDFPEIRWHENGDLFSSPASGSVRMDAMVVVPCSMNTLACIAQGISGNLIQRAAAVMLKEKRRLIVVPRETPLSTIHLENMLKLSQAGAVVLPAAPAFYHKPKTLDEAVRHVTGRILDQLNIPHELFAPWGADEPFEGERS